MKREFKDNVKVLRLSQKLNSAQMAVTFGKSEAAVRSWESGRSKPDVDGLVKICDYFKVSADWLLGIERQEPTVIVVETNLLEHSLSDLANAIAYKARKTGSAPAQTT